VLQVLFDLREPRALILWHTLLFHVLFVFFDVSLDLLKRGEALSKKDKQLIDRLREEGVLQKQVL
jgi:hypothetical protein